MFLLGKPREYFEGYEVKIFVCEANAKSFFRYRKISHSGRISCVLMRNVYEITGHWNWKISRQNAKKLDNFQNKMKRNERKVLELVILFVSEKCENCLCALTVNPIRPPLSASCRNEKVGLNKSLKCSEWMKQCDKRNFPIHKFKFQCWKGNNCFILLSGISPTRKVCKSKVM